MIQPLPYGEIKMWHVHPDLYMKKLEKFLNTPHDSDVGYFLDIDIKYPDKIKEKTKKFPFASETKVLPNDK